MRSQLIGNEKFAVSQSRMLRTAAIMLGILLASTTFALSADRDNNPPGPIGGPGTNWENPPGPVGGPGASPDRRHWRRPAVRRAHRIVRRVHRRAHRLHRRAHIRHHRLHHHH